MGEVEQRLGAALVEPPTLAVLLPASFRVYVFPQKSGKRRLARPKTERVRFGRGLICNMLCYDMLNYGLRYAEFSYYDI